MKIWGRANSINVQKVLWAADECGAEVRARPMSAAPSAATTRNGTST